MHIMMTGSRNPGFFLGFKVEGSVWRVEPGSVLLLDVVHRHLSPHKVSMVVLESRLPPQIRQLIVELSGSAIS